MAENAQVMADSLPSGTFARIFWDSQMKAATVKDARQMRWDPIMVRWCLYLRHLSSSAYETLRDTGTIRLPSQRTLRDYTHHTKATVGFSKEVDKQLQVAAKMSSCPEREKCVIIIMDEMHLREDLAYDKHTGKCLLAHIQFPVLIHIHMYIGALIGFTDIGDINSHLDEYENQLANKELRAPLATSMLLLMVRGLFTHLKFPYAQFPCTDLAGRFYIK